MSSLAGALGQPIHQSASYSSVYGLSARPEDVEMSPPDSETRDSPKEEDDEAHVAGGGEGMDDLFGNEAEETRPGREINSESILTGTPAAESGYESDNLSQAERERRRALEYAEPEEPGGVAAPPAQEFNVNIPNIPIPRSSDGQYWVIRMPNFVKVDSKPFHPDTYVGPEQEDDEISQNESVREKSMTIKLKVENTVRWRWIKDEFDQDKRQSNGRIIRWSDGSLSLRLGKELFDINQTYETSSSLLGKPAAGSQPPASQTSPSASQQTLAASKPQAQGLTYLVAQHKRSEVLQAEAAVTGYMSLRPTGMQSETHRMLVRAVGQKHNKIARLRMAPDPTRDPEREKMELMKLSAKKSKKKTEEGEFSTRRKRTGHSRKRANTDVWSDDEEEPDYEGSDADDDMGGSSSAKRKMLQEKRKGPGEYQEDDFVVADESDEDGEFGGGTSDKKRRHRDEEEEDPLDKLDAKISQLEDERKRKNQDSGGEVDDADQDMDVESEEDEEEHRVRKAGLGARKKRAIAFDEEEE
ncbi:Leo1-like protein-domain-containing protein [Pisolithus tinctorius]|nr:Leo1-like protein-domain-containing protein [Pisolithus tinctorius]